MEEHQVILILPYLAIGIVLASDTVRSYGSDDSQSWGEALGDVTGFLVITLLWLPIVGYVIIRMLKRAVWPR